MPKMAANRSSTGARVRYWCHIPPSVGQPATRRMHGLLRLSRPHPPPLSPGQMHSLGRAQPTQLLSNTTVSHPYQPGPLKGILSPSQPGSITVFPRGPSPAPLHVSLPQKKKPCPTSVLIWVFSLGGNTSALWGFASPVSTSGVQTKCSCLAAKDR